MVSRGLGGFSYHGKGFSNFDTSIICRRVTDGGVEVDSVTVVRDVVISIHQ